MRLIIRNDFDDGGVYLILNTITNQRYVGMTTNFRLRLRSHLDDLEQGRHHNTLLQFDYNRYGKEAFRFSILEKVASKEKSVLLERERVWMDRMLVFSAHGYNLSR
jgi:group I intron endonuclease